GSSCSIALCTWESATWTDWWRSRVVTLAASASNTVSTKAARAGVGMRDGRFMVATSGLGTWGRDRGVIGAAGTRCVCRKNAEAGTAPYAKSIIRVHGDVPEQGP